uniref:Uncharacterized protein MANES_13G000700 n=1 Tax=Rhizophora mucronata TaxID=61149 RepID=A0A2P2K359_RHIMU
MVDTIIGTSDSGIAISVEGVESILLNDRLTSCASSCILSTVISVCGAPGTARMLSACKYNFSTLEAPLRSSAANNGTFSCIMFKIIKGWFLRSALSVKLLRYFCC